MKPTLIILCLILLKMTAAQRDCSTVRCKAPPTGCTLVQTPGNCCNYICPTCNLYGADCVPCTLSGRCVFSNGVCTNRRGRFMAGGVARTPRQCPSTTTCTYNGNRYNIGAQFPSIDKCNTCSCNNDGSISCTEKACLGCEHKGVTYKNGDSFRDDCNSCSCSNGDVICTEIDCSVDEKSCEYNGKTYQSGESFKDQEDCNTCTCTNGQIACTEMACVPSSGCEHKGKHYEEGETFKDACNSCACNGGLVACTLMACTGCEYKGNYYEEGASFKDDCNTCRCGSNGVVGCTKMACAPSGCEHKGTHYNEGETFKDDCNSCACQDGLAVCTLMACPEDTNSGCDYNGRKYNVGEGFPSSDGCNQCSCTEQGVVCTLRACAN